MNRLLFEFDDEFLDAEIEAAALEIDERMHPLAVREEEMLWMVLAGFCLAAWLVART